MRLDVKVCHWSGEMAVLEVPDLEAPDSRTTSPNSVMICSVCAAPRARSRAKLVRSAAKGGAASRAAKAVSGSPIAKAARCARLSGVRRRRAGERRSMNRPPPSVCCAETSRMTKRSGTAAAIG